LTDKSTSYLKIATKNTVQLSRIKEHIKNV